MLYGEITTLCSEEHKKHTACEMAVCHNPHNSSNWDSNITRQYGYKDTFCQNVVSTKKKKILLLILP